MKAKVIEFPTHNVRTWAQWEKAIRNNLQETSDECQREICSRMKVIFERDFSVNLPPLVLPELPEDAEALVRRAVEDRVKSIADPVREHMNYLLTRILCLEIEPYKERHGGL